MPTRVFITDTRDRIRSGHPWVFDNQVLRIDGPLEAGEVVQVFDEKRGPLGQGFFNQASKIRVRMVAWSLDQAIDHAFFRERIQSCWRHRERFGYSHAARVVFGEADLLPALVVDKFNDVLVMQTLGLGMDQRKEMIADVLEEIFSPACIYERNDVPVRQKEGMDPVKGILRGILPKELVVEENWPPTSTEGARFRVDVENGQKTGHYLDQVENHNAIKPCCAGMKVLDCFTHTGGFAIHAARFGATEVLALDMSEEALEQARGNAELNGVSERCSFLRANVFDFLSTASRQGHQWDTIILDPPAFAKSKVALEKALGGYKEIALRAMKCLPPGGFLVTCSCSQHMTAELFRSTTASAARDAHRQVREVHHGAQTPDHPIHWAIPESHYLKCLILQVL